MQYICNSIKVVIIFEVPYIIKRINNKHARWIVEHEAIINASTGLLQFTVWFMAEGGPGQRKDAQSSRCAVALTLQITYLRSNWSVPNPDIKYVSVRRTVLDSSSFPRV